VLGSDYSEYAIPGWNEHVKDKHNVARDAFLDWLYAGKPHASRIGLHNMTKITRELSKLALRHCKQHTDTICAKNAAESLACNDYRKFCNTVHKQNNSRVTRFAQTVDETDECMGDEQIAERWRQHFQVLCNSIADNKSKIDLQSRLSTRLACANDIIIALSDVEDATPTRSSATADSSATRRVSQNLANCCTSRNNLYKSRTNRSNGVRGLQSTNV